MDRFDADAVRRILGRARSVDDGMDQEAGVDAQALVAAAEEIGYDPDTVRDSIALERLSPVGRHRGVVDRLTGPSDVIVLADVDRSVESVLDTSAAWLERAHRMTCRRVDDSSVVARRRADIAASFGRSLSELRGDGRLGRLASVEVVAFALTPAPGAAPTPRSVVRLVADRSAQRQQRLVAGGLLGGTGVATAAVGVAEAMFAWPVAAVVLGGVGAVTVASGRRHAERVERDLDALLAAIESEEAPVGTLRRVARAAKRRVGR